MRYIILLIKILLFMVSLGVIALGIFGVVAYSNIFVAAEIVEQMPDFLQSILGWVAFTSWGSVFPGLLAIGAGALLFWGATRIRVHRYYGRTSKKKALRVLAIVAAVTVAIAAVLLSGVIPGVGKADLDVPGGQLWSARNWVVAFDGAEW